MSNQTNSILNEIFKDQKFIEVYILHFKNFEENIKQSEEFYQHNVDENKNPAIQ